ncbi:amino acid permease/ SLC12A domain-containing protein [Obelidium mucronatum]|nr:amino acid permease/ SLC12A domain-containing protein [Obelidium mucronatum]
MSEKKTDVDEVVLDAAPEGHLHRKLQARHLEMIAIGGTIGTGLLLRSGGAIARAGPIGALLCFAIVGLQVFGVASSIGEMATLFPVEGAFSHFPARFVNPALGFASGWNYWLVWALTFPAEFAGIAGLMSFWVSKEQVASWIWSLVYMVPIVVVNLFPVTGFAEVEYVLCIIKIFAIVLFLIIGTFVWFGVGQTTGPLGFRNWSPAIVGETGLDRFLNIGRSFTTAFFSYGGTELVGLTAGEAANPRKSVPRAINGTFYRIVIFYLGALFLVGVLLAPDSPILKAKSIKDSPFVYAYTQAGVSFGADFMNLVIIVAASSAANSALYACARTLMRLAQEGSAPRIFAKVDRRGVPMNSVIVVALFGLVAVAVAYSAGKEGTGLVFDWLSGVISYGIMANWMIMSYTHLRFRKGYLSQGRKVEDLPYVAPFYPYADYVSLTIGSVVTVFLLVSAFYSNGVASEKFFTTQCHGALKSGFKFVSFEDMDFETGRFIETASQKEENDHIHDKPKNLKEWGQKIWYKLF